MLMPDLLAVSAHVHGMYVHTRGRQRSAFGVILEARSTLFFETEPFTGTPMGPRAP